MESTNGKSAFPCLFSDFYVRARLFSAFQRCTTHGTCGLSGTVAEQKWSVLCATAKWPMHKLRDWLLVVVVGGLLFVLCVRVRAT